MDHFVNFLHFFRLITHKTHKLLLMESELQQKILINVRYKAYIKNVAHLAIKPSLAKCYYEGKLSKFNKLWTSEMVIPGVI